MARKTTPQPAKKTVKKSDGKPKPWTPEEVEDFSPLQEGDPAPKGELNTSIPTPSGPSSLRAGDRRGRQQVTRAVAAADTPEKTAALGEDKCATYQDDRPVSQQGEERGRALAALVAEHGGRCRANARR